MNFWTERAKQVGHADKLGKNQGNIYLISDQIILHQLCTPFSAEQISLQAKILHF